MKTNLACFALATLLFASCEKKKETATDDSSLKIPPPDNQAGLPANVEKTATMQPESAGVPAVKSYDAPLPQPVTAEMIRPAGIVAGDASWETLTAEQMIEKFNSNGIARMPKHLSDTLLANAASAGAPEVQVQFITQQAAAWHQINEFKEGVNDIPEHMKSSMIEKLSTKYGNSWMDMVPEIEEQMAASRKVMEFRLKGIPGMSADDSQQFLINALEKYGTDYKTILSIAEQKVKK